MKRKRSVKVPAARSYKKRKVSKKQLVKAVRQTINRMSETKKLFVDIATAHYFHQPYIFTPIYWITQGTTEGNRIGDQIHLNALHLRMKISRKGEAGDRKITGRVYCVYSKSNYKDGIVGPTWAVQNPSDFYKSTDNLIDAFLQGDRHKIIKYKTFSLAPCYLRETSGFTVPSADAHVEFRVPLNKKFQYDNLNSGYGKYGNYFFMMVLDGAEITGATTAVNVVTRCLVTWKDL